MERGNLRYAVCKMPNPTKVLAVFHNDEADLATELAEQHGLSMIDLESWPWEAVRDLLRQPGPPTEPPSDEPHKIVVIMEGGLIQDISNIPPGVIVETRDFDCDEKPPGERENVEGFGRSETGKVEYAWVGTWLPSAEPPADPAEKAPDSDSPAVPYLECRDCGATSADGAEFIVREKMVSRQTIVVADDGSVSLCDSETLTDEDSSEPLAIVCSACFQDDVRLHHGADNQTVDDGADGILAWADSGGDALPAPAPDALKAYRFTLGTAFGGCSGGFDSTEDIEELVLQFRQCIKGAVRETEGHGPYTDENPVKLFLSVCDARCPEECQGDCALCDKLADEPSAKSSIAALQAEKCLCHELPLLARPCGRCAALKLLLNDEAAATPSDS